MHTNTHTRKHTCAHTHSSIHPSILDKRLFLKLLKGNFTWDIPKAHNGSFCHSALAGRPGLLPGPAVQTMVVPYLHPLSLCLSALLTQSALSSCPGNTHQAAFPGCRSPYLAVRCSFSPDVPHLTCLERGVKSLCLGMRDCDGVTAGGKSGEIPGGAGSAPS